MNNQRANRSKEKNRRKKRSTSYPIHAVEKRERSGRRFLAYEDVCAEEKSGFVFVVALVLITPPLGQPDALTRYFRPRTPSLRQSLKATPVFFKGFSRDRRDTCVFRACHQCP